MREWYMLTDLQKEKFVSEYLGELKKQYQGAMEALGLDYLKALGEGAISAFGFLREIGEASGNGRTGDGRRRGTGSGGLRLAGDPAPAAALRMARESINNSFSTCPRLPTTPPFWRSLVLTGPLLQFWKLQRDIATGSIARFFRTVERIPN